MSQGLTPYLCCADASAAIEFYVTAFGATEVSRWTAPDGRIGHAELDLPGGRVYLADEHPEIGVRGPRSLGGTPVSFVLTVPDTDATVTRAVAAGATVERPASTDLGARSAWIFDPYGHRWNLRTPVEELSAEQLRDQVGDAYEISGDGAS